MLDRRRPRDPCPMFPSSAVATLHLTSSFGARCFGRKERYKLKLRRRNWAITPFCSATATSGSVPPSTLLRDSDLTSGPPSSSEGPSICVACPWQCSHRDADVPLSVVSQSEWRTKTEGCRNEQPATVLVTNRIAYFVDCQFSSHPSKCYASDAP